MSRQVHVDASARYRRQEKITSTTKLRLCEGNLI